MRDWQLALDDMPLIGILRGISPKTCVEIARVLYDEGFQILEVPLNSPSPYDSIRQLTLEFPDRIIGAGTVTTPAQVQACADSGCRLIIAPNFSPTVADAAKKADILYCPGVVTPTEAFLALESGADALKLFPAELVTPDVVRAMRAVLPDQIPLITVGGITPDNMGPYLAAGANGFGIGSALYRPGKSASNVRAAAREFVCAFRAGPCR